MGIMPITVHAPDDVRTSTPTMAPGGAPRFASFQPAARTPSAVQSPPEGTHSQARQAFQDHSKVTDTRREHKHRERTEHRHHEHTDTSSTRHRHRARTEHVASHESTKQTSLMQEDPLFVIDRFGDADTARLGPSKYTTPKYERTNHRMALGQAAPSAHPQQAAPSKNLIQAPPPVPGSPSHDEAAYVELERPKEASTLQAYRDPYRTTKTPKSRGKLTDAPVFAQDSVQALSRKLHERTQQNPSDIRAWFDLAELQALMVHADPTTPLSRAEESSVARMQMAVLDRAEEASEHNKGAMPLVLGRLLLAANVGLWTSEKLNRAWRNVLEEYVGRRDASLREYCRLWWLYVHFRKSDWASFALDDMLGIFEEALAAPQQTMFAADLDIVHAFQLHIVSELCSTLRSAGYQERAYGILQGLLELHLGVLENGRHPHLKFEHITEIFGAWWDAEHARVGDTLPYDGFHLNHDQNVVRQLSLYLQNASTLPQEQPDGGETLGNQEMVAWQRTELNAAEHASPWRFEDDLPGMSVDPFSYVLFDDLRMFMVEPSSNVLASTIRVADALFAYVGMPSHWFSASLLFGQTFLPVDNELRQRPTVWPDMEHFTVPSEMWSQEPWLQSDNAHPLSVQNVPLTPDTFFPRTSQDPRGRWFCVLPRLTMKTAQIAERILVHVEQRLSAAGYKDLASMIALPHAMVCAAAGNPKSARKVLRAALQRNDQLIMLWYAYAQLELSTWGNVEAARKVVVQVLGSVGCTTSHSHAYEAHLLWALWSEMEWAMGDVTTTLRVLSVAAAAQLAFVGEPSSLHARVFPAQKEALRGTEKLHTLQTLRKQVERACNDTESYARKLASLAFCTALAEFLLQDVPAGDELTVPASIFTNVLAAAQGSAQQQTAAAFQRFLYTLRHVCPNAAFRPREVRAITTRLAQENAQNSCHLQVLTLQEQHAHVENHVRNFLQTTVLQKGTMGAWTNLLLQPAEEIVDGWYNAEQTWILAIVVELRMQRHVDADRIRRLFDRALYVMRASSILWHLAIGFEMHLLANPAGQRRRESNQTLQRAKALIYQAIRHCPFDKCTLDSTYPALYLKAFSPRLDAVLDARELYALATMMEEKQLRIYTDLAEPVHADTLQEHDAVPDEAGAKDRIATFVDDIAAATARCSS